jgi:hypothetical protein
LKKLSAFSPIAAQGADHASLKLFGKAPHHRDTETQRHRDTEKTLRMGSSATSERLVFP